MIDAVVHNRVKRIQNERLKELMISSSGFAFDPRSGLTYMVNLTGADVIRWLNDGLTDDDVVDRIRDEYDVDGHTAKRDFDSFLLSLRQHTLI
jgi:Coenzyme PQQ synthesis protein D (PqqD)